MTNRMIAIIELAKGYQLQGEEIGQAIEKAIKEVGKLEKGIYENGC